MKQPLKGRSESRRKWTQKRNAFLPFSSPLRSLTLKNTSAPRVSKLFSAQQSSLYSHVSTALAFIICSFISKENAVMFEHLSCNFSSGSSSITVPGPVLQWYLYSNQRKPKCTFCRGVKAAALTPSSEAFTYILHLGTILKCWRDSLFNFHIFCRQVSVHIVQ